LKRTAKLLQLIASGTDYLRAKQDNLSTEFRLWEWPRYDWDQETRQLVFSEKGRPRVISDIQFVGSVSTRSDSWLWSWANDSVDGRLTSAASTVRKYGEENDLEHLTTGSWHAHEPDGWEMTSVTALLTSAVGAYRSPKEGGFTFMVLTDVRWAS
jgi:hypothetical protein